MSPIAFRCWKGLYRSLLSSPFIIWIWLQKAAMTGIRLFSVSKNALRVNLENQHNWKMQTIEQFICTVKKEIEKEECQTRQGYTNFHGERCQIRKFWNHNFRIKSTENTTHHRCSKLSENHSRQLTVRKQTMKAWYRCLNLNRLWKLSKEQSWQKKGGKMLWNNSAR